MPQDPSATHSRNYPLLLIGQFLGAFGDNFLLAAILAPLTYELGAGHITEAVINGENALFGLAFAVPSIVLAPLAGYLNDRMPKTRWLAGGNIIKFAGAALGLAGLTLYSGGMGHAIQVAGYCVVGVGSCVYAPAKYGILPEILPGARLVKANGTVEMLTLVAIVTGLMGGVLLYDATHSVRGCYIACAALYIAALMCNIWMTRTPHNPAASLVHVAGEFARSFASLVSSPRLGRILLGSALFWFAGSTLRSSLQGWGIRVFQEAGVAAVTNVKLVLLKLGLVVGIVAGAFLAGQLHRTGDLTWARRYGLLLAAGVAGLGLVGGQFGLTPVVLVLIVTGAAAGLLVVPFNAALQAETDPGKLGKTVSIQSCTDYIGIAGGNAFLSFLSRYSLNPEQDLVILSVTIALVALSFRVPSGPRSPQATGSQPGS